MVLLEERRVRERASRAHVAGQLVAHVRRPEAVPAELSVPLVGRGRSREPEWDRPDAGELRVGFTVLLLDGERPLVRVFIGERAVLVLPRLEVEAGFGGGVVAALAVLPHRVLFPVSSCCGAACRECVVRLESSPVPESGIPRLQSHPSPRSRC